GVAGAAGGGAGAGLMPFGFNQDDLQGIVAELQPGTSAIVAWVEPTGGDKLASELEQLHGKIVRRLVRDVATAEMKATLGRWQAQADARIQKLNGQIAELQTKLATTTATTQADARKQLDTLRAQRNEAQAQFEEQLAAQAHDLETRRDALRARLGQQRDDAQTDLHQQLTTLPLQGAL